MNEHVQTTTTEPLFNPLAPDFIRDPYPHYERLRTTDPMHLTPLGSFVASRHAEASLSQHEPLDAAAGSPRSHALARTCGKSVHGSPGRGYATAHPAHRRP